MPQVPMFQGGLPQVGAQVGGGMVVQAPRPSTDYARTMAVATKPIEEFAGNLQKMAEVGFARDVKAKSDEAEIAAMRVIDGALYGEDGYLNRRGEEASTAFEGSMKSIESGISDIVGSLPEPVRDAVGSRLQERVMNAQRTMTQWRSEQTREWHLRSSQARVDAIISDAGNHYADGEYFAKSLASAVDEVNYQAAALGMPPEVRDEEIKKLHAAMQVNRLTTWAQDDPVGAFHDLQNVRSKIDAATYGKLDAGLWARAKPLLAYRLSQDAPYIRRAQEAYQQPDFSDQYNTKLTPDEEKQFQKWAKESGREKDVYDYDLRGAWKELQSGEMSEDARGHLGDKYKKPNHPTFSSQSIYANGDGGTWSVDAAGHDVFTPGKKLSEAQADYLREYFARVEPGAVLNLDGRVESSSGSRRQTLDPMRPTGIPEIDNLSAARRIELFSRVKMIGDRGRAEQTSELRRAVENSLAVAGQDGVDPNPLDLTDFVSVYGEQKGAVEFEEYSNNLSAREKIHSFSGLSNTDIAATVDAMKPIRGSDTYADQLKLYQAAQKAAGVVVKARREDPVGAALGDSRYGLEPITSWNDPQLGQKLTARSAAADQISADYGVRQPKLLTDDECSNLLATLQPLGAEDRGAVLTKLAQAMPGDGDIGKLAAQLGPKNRLYGTALYLMASDVGKGVQFLKGKEWISEGRVKLPESGYGSIADIRRQIGDSEDGYGITQNPALRETLVDAVVGMYAYGQEITSGDAAGPGNLDDAIEAAVGSIAVWNGRKIVLPKRANGESYEDSSWFGANFEDLMKSTQDRLKKEKGWVKTGVGKMPVSLMANELPNMQLETIDADAGEYRIIDPRLGYVRNADDSIYVLNVLPQEQK